MVRIRRQAHQNGSTAENHVKYNGVSRGYDADDRKKKNIYLPLPIWALVLMCAFLIGFCELVAYEYEANEKQRYSKENEIPVSQSSRLDHKNYGKRKSRTPKRKFEPAPLLDSDGSKLHIVFSTDCSAYQQWQSYMLFYSALRVKQPGHVTRIASGCSDIEASLMMEWHQSHITVAMSERFGLHLTPAFSKISNADGSKRKVDYKYFNKPFGLRHWLEHGEGMGLDAETGKMIDESVIVILIDPDMMLLRPIRADYSDTREVLRRFKDGKYPVKDRVDHGFPFASRYGMGSQWRDFNLDKITGDPNSPAKAVEKQDGFKYFPAGPPYIATARDMYKIAVKWTQFAPLVNEEYPHLLGEMFAYCIAAAHLELPHQLLSSLMVSDQAVPGEAWSFVEQIPTQEICRFAENPKHDVYPIPNVVHYCQSYHIGNTFFSKRQVQKNFFTCASDKLKAPASNITEEVTYYHKKNGFVKDPKHTKRVMFMLCSIIPYMNDARDFYMQNHCDNVPGTK